MTFDTGNSIVNEMAKINITGTVVPNGWFSKITNDSGKAYLLAIIILADIVYWYRPSEIRDEYSGKTIGYKKKFKADLLQRNYDNLSQMFGCSKRQATNAIVHLEKMGLIKRHFRTITTNNDMKLSNVLFIELRPKKLVELGL